VQTIQRKLVDHLSPRAEESIVSDVRIGLGYTAVALEGGHTGVAWTPKTESNSCTHFSSAGSLTGRSASVLLAMLCHQTSPLARAVGLATANALLSALPHPEALPDEVIASLNLTPDDRVAMVGHFAPLVTNIRKTGSQLDIIELKPGQGDTIGPEKGRAILAECSVAIITATSLINGSLDGLLADLGTPRAAVILGPSTPLCPEAFEGTAITHLAGARVKNGEAVLRIISEGGGTMLMKPHLEFVNLPLEVAR